jgi:hypothetical protein
MNHRLLLPALSCALLASAIAATGCTGDLVTAGGSGDDGGTGPETGPAMNGPGSSGHPVTTGAAIGSPSPGAGDTQPDATAVTSDAGPAPYGDSGVTPDAWIQPDTCPISVLQAITTVADTVSTVEGKWVVCDGLQNLTTWAPSDTVGIEFTTGVEDGGSCNESIGQCLGGLIYFLVQGPNGLERGPTNDYQKYYSVYQENATWVQFNFNEFPNNGGTGSSVSYSPSPLEFSLDDFNYTSGVRLIRPAQ